MLENCGTIFLLMEYCTCPALYNIYLSGLGVGSTEAFYINLYILISTLQNIHS